MTALLSYVKLCSFLKTIKPILLVFLRCITKCKWLRTWEFLRTASFLPGTLYKHTQTYTHTRRLTGSRAEVVQDWESKTVNSKFHRPYIFRTFAWLLTTFYGIILRSRVIQPGENSMANAQTVRSFVLLSHFLIIARVRWFSVVIPLDWPEKLIGNMVNASNGRQSSCLSSNRFGWAK